MIDYKWITSDHHFGHTNIIEYCDRPFKNLQEMHQYMINQWNSVVSDNDNVLHLGDFALGMDEQEVTDIVSQLNGNIYLISGNHDRFGKAKFKRCGFIDVYNSIVTNRYDIGKNVVFTHRPVPVRELIKKDKFNVHGHIHNSIPQGMSDFHVNVSVEMWDYKPINIKDLMTNFG